MNIREWLEKSGKTWGEESSWSVGAQRCISMLSIGGNDSAELTIFCHFSRLGEMI